MKIVFIKCLLLLEREINKFIIFGIPNSYKFNPEWTIIYKLLIKKGDRKI